MSSTTSFKAKAVCWAVGFAFIGAAMVWAELQDPTSSLSHAASSAWAFLTSPLTWVIAAAVLVLVAFTVIVRSRRGLGLFYPRLHRREGMAGRLEVLWYGSAWAPRRMAKAVRPNLATNPFRRQLRHRTVAFGQRMGRIGLLVAAWVSHEDVTLRVAPPRAGKSGELANKIVDAPGADFVTSTKLDLLDLTRYVRELRNAVPVEIFNPECLGDFQHRSTVRWSPLTGCTDPSVAVQRAAALLSGAPGASGIGDRAWWESRAVSVLATYLHAAALGALTLLDVQRWVADDPEVSRAEVSELLIDSPSPVTERANLTRFCELNDKTRTSITESIAPALEWLRDPNVAMVALCQPGEGFDVAAFLAQRGTIYLVGSDRQHGTIAPLFSAFTSWFFEEAKKVAAATPGGRLDPPLTMVLDEAPLICPVPLDRWTSDAGGRGIAIHIACQAKAQLVAKWGPEAAAVIWSNATAKLIYGGIDDPDDLRDLSELCGKVDVPAYSITEGEGGKASKTKSTRTVPVFTASDIRRLPRFHALLLRKGMRPTVVRVRPIWKRIDVRWLNRRAKHLANPTRRDWTAALRPARSVRTAAGAALSRVSLTKKGR